MSKLLTLKEVVEMNSDEFHESFLKEQQLLNEEIFSISAISGLFALLWVRKEAKVARTAMAAFLKTGSYRDSEKANTYHQKGCGSKNL